MVKVVFVLHKGCVIIITIKKGDFFLIIYLLRRLNVGKKESKFAKILNCVLEGAYGLNRIKKRSIDRRIHGQL